jgi:hypothetical protein
MAVRDVKRNSWLLGSLLDLSTSDDDWANPKYLIRAKLL